MRRIALVLILVALVVGLHACAADAPTRPPTGGGGQPSSALTIQLFTNDANPRAGTCTLIEAVVALNGTSVPDGTTVSFSSDFGSFSQNGLPAVSVVTQNGTAVTALCGPGPGTAKVKATSTSAGKTGSATLTIIFQPDSGTLPFVSSCNPSFASTLGGDTITLNGGRFFGTVSTTRIQFTANGITKDGIVTSVGANAITVQTPAFSELSAPSTLTVITLTLGTNQATPVVLSLPNCFTFGTTNSGTPTISALLPSSGTNDGNTRVTIVGSGFSSSGVQVFFGTTEATVVSVNFNQIVALSPPAFGVGSGNLNQTVDVTVKNIGSGIVSNAVQYRYAPAVQLTAISNNIQRIDALSTVTIFGQGFQAPVAVTLAGVGAVVQSVSATELLVVPGLPFVIGCTNITGDVSVTNINSGDTATGLSFTYAVPTVVVLSVSPQTDGGGLNTTATITGTGFPANLVDAEVKFGSKTAFVQSATTTQIVVTIPPGTVFGSPVCVPPHVPPDQQIVETVDVTVTNRATTCSATLSQAFSYTLPCVVPTPTP